MSALPLSSALVGTAELVRRTLPRGALALQKPPVLADVRSKVLQQQLSTEVPNLGPIRLGSPGASFDVVVKVAPMMKWSLEDGSKKGRHVDTVA